MYLVGIQRVGQEAERLIAEDVQELKEIVDLASEVNYEILLVEKVNIEYAREFLEKVNKELQGKKGLVTGKSKEDK